MLVRWREALRAREVRAMGLLVSLPAAPRGRQGEIACGPVTRLALKWHRPDGRRSCSNLLTAHEKKNPDCIFSGAGLASCIPDCLNHPPAGLPWPVTRICLSDHPVGEVPTKPRG